MAEMQRTTGWESLRAIPKKTAAVLAGTALFLTGCGPSQEHRDARAWTNEAFQAVLDGEEVDISGQETLSIASGDVAGLRRPEGMTNAELAASIATEQMENALGVDSGLNREREPFVMAACVTAGQNGLLDESSLEQLRAAYNFYEELGGPETHGDLQTRDALSAVLSTCSAPVNEALGDGGRVVFVPASPDKDRW